MVGARQGNQTASGERRCQLVGRINEIVLANDYEHGACHQSQPGGINLKPGRTFHNGQQCVEVIAGLFARTERNGGQSDQAMPGRHH